MKAAATARYNHEIKNQALFATQQERFFTRPLKGRADESRPPAFLAPAAVNLCGCACMDVCVKASEELITS